MSKKCNRCKNGVIDTGNDKLPCDCPKGYSALFNVADVEGLVSGAEFRRHFFNGSPESLIIPLVDGEIMASKLPGRNKDTRELKKIFRQFWGLLEIFDREEMSQVKALYACVRHLHTLTSKMLGK